MAESTQITDLLIAWSNGEAEAMESLLPLIERELQDMAHRYMRREQAGHMLQTTALINEAYLRLVNQQHVRWQNRAHFFGIAAQMMRRVLLNHARDQERDKRGGKMILVSLSEAETLALEQSVDFLALDEALNRLQAQDPRKSKVVELRYFGGLSVEETAEVLRISPITVMRDWNLAKAWLARELEHGR